MPRTKLSKAVEEEKVEEKQVAVKESLNEGEALVKNKKNGTELKLDAIHAITVMVKQGWDVVDINLDINKAVDVCNNYDIDYIQPPTKSNLMEVIQKRF